VEELAGEKRRKDIGGKCGGIKVLDAGLQQFLETFEF
jgi:hypothetical protein